MIDPSSGVLLGSVFDQCGVPVVITTAPLSEPDPLVVYANESFETLTGYRTSELLGKSPRILQGELTDRAVIERLKSDLAIKGNFRGRVINYRKDGQSYLVEWIISALIGGAQSYWISFQRQIDESRPDSRRNSLAATRNLLQSVQALATRTFGKGPANVSFSRRLQSLSRAQSIRLMPRDRQTLQTIINVEAQAADILPSEVVCTGAPIIVPENMLEAISLLFGELFGQAKSHGAFAMGKTGGRVAINWQQTLDVRNNLKLRVVWENHIPMQPTAALTSETWDLTLLEEIYPFAFGGDSRPRFSADGARLMFEIVWPI